MAGQPELSFYKDEENKHRWRIVGGNGEVMAVSSEGYSSRSNAFRAWETIEEAICGVSDEKQRETKDV